jgi:hypothetical protein
MAADTHLTSVGHGTEGCLDSSLDIFSIARRYTDGEIDLDAMQEWIVPRLGEFLVDARSTAAELAGLIELVTADVQCGESDLEEARAVISEFLRQQETITLARDSQTTSGNGIRSIGPLFAGSPDSSFTPFQPLPAGR